MRLDVGGGIEFRDVRYGDEDAVYEICSDWTVDGKRFTRSRAERAVQKYVNDMLVEPGEHPATADSRYREALIAFTPSGEPLALIAYVVRGGNDPKNWPVPACILTTEFFVIAPAQRGAGYMDRLLNALMRSAFEHTGVDALAHDLVDSPEMRSHDADRGYSNKAQNGRHDRVSWTKEEQTARLAANPSEASTRIALNMERNNAAN